jgi:ABC-type branched-subunit amino acid transport system ATPase component
MQSRVLEIRDISKSFALGYSGRSGRYSVEQKNVIDGLTMDVKRNEVTALVGGNGAGKTSLFNLISGLLKPDRGRVLFYGNDKTLDCIRARPWEAARAGIGRMFQGVRIFGQLSVMDHLVIQACTPASALPFHYFLMPHKSKKLTRRIREKIMDELDHYPEVSAMLADPARPVSSLSYAQQRILSLAGLVAGQYSLLLLDEPTSGLSAESFDTLYGMIEKMQQQGRSIFLIEHNMLFIKNAAAHCHFMSAGKILYSGPPDEVLDHEEVKKSYLL